MDALLAAIPFTVRIPRRVPRPGAAMLALSGLLCVMVYVPCGAAGKNAVRVATISLPKSPSAAEVVARMSASDELLETYAVPLHIDARVRRLITLHFGRDGTVYYKRPDHLALSMRSIPAGFRKLFAEMGTAQTWPSTYDMSIVDAVSESGREIYRLKGVPKQAGDVDHLLLDVSGEDFATQRARWLCKDGSTIDMTFVNESSGGYALAKRAEADMVLSGWKIHATLEYGPYVLNESVADSVFSDS
jgi:hypothetical protein